MKFFRSVFSFLLFLSLLFVPILSSCAKNVQKSARSTPDEQDANAERTSAEARAREYVANMELGEKCLQLILANIDGNEHFDASNVIDAVPGGYLFFAYNFADSAEKISSFTKSIADYCRNNGLAAPYLATDHEGGGINRIRHLSALSSAREMAKNRSADEAEQLYAQQGKLLSELGMHINLAPVAESANADNAAFLAERSYGSIENAVSFSLAAVNGYARAGVACVLKHFPGNTNDDPHRGLPVIRTSARTIEQDYIEPFRRIIDASHPEGVLMSHARVLLDSAPTDEYAYAYIDDPAGYADANLPACLSEFWVTEVLRKKLRFGGLIFSDDIYMSALRKNGFPPEKAAFLAVNAGCDVIMFSGKHVAPLRDYLVQAALTDPSFAQKIDDAAVRIIMFKIAHKILDL
ncbi:MAG: glycoside hydrolase family 3 N-terminal domain-containing protein [Treponemataceae bacterium]|nr:MAG: glycoside hydrolase family 3 N-terminal domain-containing protein [Treponemataceae bacterium]